MLAAPPNVSEPTAQFVKSMVVNAVHVLSPVRVVKFVQSEAFNVVNAVHPVRVRAVREALEEQFTVVRFNKPDKLSDTSPH